ncbi:MAG: lytic murein transglycosylase B [Gammaproteobacteria bacterium]|nr:MAG: lytic murein transglycosylase B [Gammaproteobacteria bacterium]
MVWFVRVFFILLLSCSIAFASSEPTETNYAQRKDVQAFIQQMVKKYHFNATDLEALFSTVKVRPQVIRLIKKPLEQEPWYTYRMLFVSEWRIQHGVEFWNKYEKELRRAEETYGVPASIIVATIGIESRYGERMGSYRVIDSLSNIAFSRSPRAPYFRKELEQFLLLTREQHLDPLKVMGSYAGAIGQPQFMPSAYRYLAVDFSSSGKIDLMHDEVDIIGSIANYYRKMGWKTDEPVVAPALIIGDRYHYLLRNDKIKQSMTVSELMKYGIVPRTKISPEQQKVKIIELQNYYNNEYWLGFHNFDVIKRYNASDLYAMAVYQLSSYITLLRDRLNNG